LRRYQKLTQRAFCDQRSVREQAREDFNPLPSARVKPARLTSSAARSVSPPSRPGDLHPEPLTDPDMTLSRHPARATTRRLPPSVERWGSSRRQMASVGPLRLQ
jgi:hypothetical protein